MIPNIIIHYTCIRFKWPSEQTEGFIQHLNTYKRRYCEYLHREVSNWILSVVVIFHIIILQSLIILLRRRQKGKKCQLSVLKKDSTTHQSRYSEELNRESSHRHWPLVIILHKISLQLPIILNNKGKFTSNLHWLDVLSKFHICDGKLCPKTGNCLYLKLLNYG